MAAEKKKKSEQNDLQSKRLVLTHTTFTRVKIKGREINSFGSGSV
jgi:hypothetical protein